MSTAEPLQTAGGLAGPIGPTAPRQRQPVAGNFLGLEYKWLVAIAVIFGLFMAVLDTTVVNIALPKLQAVFGATLNDVQWIITAYTLAQSIGNWHSGAAGPSARPDVGRLYRPKLRLAADLLYQRADWYCGIVYV